MTIELTRNFLLNDTYTYKTQNVLKVYVIEGWQSYLPFPMQKRVGIFIPFEDFELNWIVISGLTLMICIIG